LNTTNWFSKAALHSIPPTENRARVVRVATGPGTGESCAYCYKQIDGQAVQYAVDAYIAAGVLRTLHFHRVCLHLWEALLSHTPSVPTADARQ